MDDGDFGLFAFPGPGCHSCCNSRISVGKINAKMWFEPSCKTLFLNRYANKARRQKFFEVCKQKEKQDRGSLMIHSAHSQCPFPIVYIVST